MTFVAQLEVIVVENHEDTPNAAFATTEQKYAAAGKIENNDHGIDIVELKFTLGEGEPKLKMGDIVNITGSVQAAEPQTSSTE